MNLLNFHLVNHHSILNYLTTTFIYISYIQIVKTPFEELLEICVTYQFPGFKNYIESYLRERYTYKYDESIPANKYIPFTTTAQTARWMTYKKDTYCSLSGNQNASFCLTSCLPILILADKYKLKKLRKHLLSLSFHVQSWQSVVVDNKFKNLHLTTKYELNMKAIRAFLPKDKTEIDGQLVDTPNSEGMLLLPFFDTLFYENRTIDNSPPKKFEECRTSDVKIDHPFHADQENADRIIEVGNYQLHVNSLKLSQNSTVFERMFNGDFKEAKEEVVRLEGDDPVKIIQLFKHFDEHREIRINGTSLF